MKVYQISYELRNQSHFEPLFKRINACGYWCRPLESTWIITSTQGVLELRSELVKVLGDDDRLLVTRLHGDAAWQGIDPDSATWMNNQMHDTDA